MNKDNNSIFYPEDDILNTIIERIVACANPDRIILFGSRAKGVGRKSSDYDLLVVKNGITNTRSLAQELYMALHGILAPVDIVVATDEIIKKNRHKFWMIYKSALEEGLPIYG